MKDILNSPRILEIKRKRRIRKIRLSVFLFVLLLSIIGAFSYYSFDSRITINKITVNGTHIIDQEDVESVVQKDINGKYFYLFSKANSFIYPRKYIYNDLIERFPRIKKLEVSRLKLDTIDVEIEEKIGSYLYCGSSVPEILSEIGENCYFVNDDGFIFDKAPYFSGNVYFKYYIDINKDDPLSQNILPVNRFHELVRFIDELKNISLDSNYIVISNDGNSYLYLDYKIGNTNPQLIFKNDADLDLIYDNLSLAMQKKEFSDEIKSKYNSLLYIDLRFDNKVLYKFQ